MSELKIYNFMGLRRVAVIFSAVLLLVSTVSLFSQGLVLGLDFSGGTQIEVGYKQPVNVADVRGQLKNAGFEFEIATQTGKPVVFEMWAFPEKDEHVKSIYNELESSFKHPTKLQEFIDNSFDKTESYAAVFIPGGHGSMIGIPEDINVGKILNWAHENDLFTISLCHGPGSFLATTLNNQKFLYEGYNMAVFPDSVDNQTPMFGFLPGKMPYGLSEKLKSLCVNLVNTKMDKTVCLDRKLITGSSPLASNNLGKLAAETLLKALK